MTQDQVNMLGELLQIKGELNDWELSFVEDLWERSGANGPNYRRLYNLTDRQTSALQLLYDEKVAPSQKRRPKYDEELGPDFFKD